MWDGTWASGRDPHLACVWPLAPPVAIPPRHCHCHCQGGDGALGMAGMALGHAHSPHHPLPWVEGDMGQGYNDLECNCTPNPSYMTPPPSITILPLYCRVDMAAWGWRGWRIYPPTHQATCCPTSKVTLGNVLSTWVAMLRPMGASKHFLTNKRIARHYSDALSL